MCPFTSVEPLGPVAAGCWAITGALQIIATKRPLDLSVTDPEARSSHALTLRRTARYVRSVKSLWGKG